MISNTQFISQPRHWLRHNSSFLIRLLLVVGVLVGSVILPAYAPRSFLPLILGLPLVIGVMLLFLRWRSLGILALFGTMIIPVDGPSGLNASMLLVALLLGLWILDIVTGRETTPLPDSQTIRPLVFFIMIACVALGVGQLPWFATVSSAPLDAQLGGLSVFILSAGAFLLVARYIRDLGQLEKMTWIFLIVGSVYMAGRLFPPLTFIVRVFPGGAAGSMLWTWLVALAFGQIVINRRLTFPQRLLLVGLVLATIYVAYFRAGEWKSGWLPPLVALVVVIGLRWPRLGLLLALGGLVLAPDVVAQIVTTDQYSYSTRIDAWLLIAEIIRVNPILGLGPANYYFYTPLFPIRGYAVRFNSHNQYVDLVAQTGLLGLIAFLWFFWEVSKLGWRLRTQVPAGFGQAYVYSALGGLAGTLVAGILGDWVLPFVYNVTLSGFRASVLAWLFLGGLLALDQMTPRSSGAAGLVES